MMRNNKLIKTALLAFIFVFSSNLFGQKTSHSPSNEYQLSYAEFLQKLTSQNLGYLAEQYNINIAEAEIEAAKILPDPELSFSAYDNQERRMKMGYGFEVELEWDLELGGKRKARKKLAKDEYELTHLELSEYFQELKTESTIKYLKALRDKAHFDFEEKSYKKMLDLAKQDSIYFEEGKIKKNRANQIKLEILSKRNHLQDVADQWKNSLSDLKSIISTEKHDTIYIPQGNLENFDRVFSLEELIENAKNNRIDLKISQHNNQLADSKIDLEKAERVMDLGLSVGVENNSFAKNIIGPTPGHTAVFAGISVPLKFSNNKDAGLKTAYYEKEQAQLTHQQLVLDFEKEIEEAYRDYLTKQEQVKAMKENIEEAESIFEEEIEGYLNNENSLLEVLNSERAYSKLQNNYIHTLYEYAKTLVELESLTGIWDIDF